MGALLGGSWYLLSNYNCTYNHIRALKGLMSKVRSGVCLGFRV